MKTIPDAKQEPEIKKIRWGIEKLLNWLLYVIVKLSSPGGDACFSH